MIPTPDQIAQARRASQVPDDWIWKWCSNHCGDIVFYPADMPDDVVVVCSPACGMNLLRERGAL